MNYTIKINPAKLKAENVCVKMAEVIIIYNLRRQRVISVKRVTAS
jgi:hypothetical protein